MLTQALLLLAVCTAGLIFAAVDDVRPVEVFVWVVGVIVVVGAMSACPEVS